jgi:hypothetical protein
VGAERDVASTEPRVCSKHVPDVVDANLIESDFAEAL